MPGAMTAVALAYRLAFSAVPASCPSFARMLRAEGCLPILLVRPLAVFLPRQLPVGAVRETLPVAAPLNIDA